MKKQEIVRELEFIHLFRAIASFWVLAAHCMIWGVGMEYHYHQPK
jgi:hypothetical protein